MHDLSEDAYLLSPYRISLNFGPEIALDVRALTKLPKRKETTKEYLGRVVSRGQWAITAKLCDRLHNLSTLDGCSPEKRERQIKETQEYHLPMLIPALREYGDHWLVYADTLKAKIEEVLEQLS